METNFALLSSLQDFHYHPVFDNLNRLWIECLNYVTNTEQVHNIRATMIEIMCFVRSALVYTYSIILTQLIQCAHKYFWCNVLRNENRKETINSHNKFETGRILIFIQFSLVNIYRLCSRHTACQSIPLKSSCNIEIG